jgi:hypothetical protein
VERAATAARPAARWDTAAVGVETSSGVVGRRSEHDALLRAVRRGLGGTPGLAVVVGEPGIGKSTLAGEVAAGLRAGGTRVVYGSADEHDRTAYGLWREPWARLAPSSALLDAALPTEEQRWEVLARLSEALADGPPMLLVLEDLHWADDLSLWVLARLTTGLAGRPLAVVATCRGDGAGAVLEQLRPADVVELGGLDRSEVAEMVSHLDPHAALDPAELLDRTGGNPLLIREVVRSSDGLLPARVGSVLQQSLLVLAPDARRVVAGLAVAGPDVPLLVLGQVVDLPTPAVVSAIDEAVVAEILVRKPLGAVAFRHALLADAAADSLDPQKRRRLHLRLGEAWDAMDGDSASARAARHLANAVPLVPQSQVATRVRAVAARALRAGDPTRAAELLEEALQAGGRDPAATASTRGWLLLDLAEAHWAAGGPEPGRVAFEAAADVAAEAGDAELLARAEAGAVRAASPWEDDPARRARLEAAAAGLPPGDHAVRVELYGRLSVMCLVSPALRAQSLRWGEEAVAMARRLGDPALLATALVDRHLAPVSPEEIEARTQVADELLHLGERAERPDLVLVGLEWQYGAHMTKGEVRAAERAVDRMEALAAVMPSPRWRFGALIRRGMLTAYSGERDLALLAVERAVPFGAGALDDLEVKGVVVGARLIISRIFGRPDPEITEPILALSGPPALAGLPFFDVRNALGMMVAGDPTAARACIARWTPRLDALLYGFHALTTLALLASMVAELRVAESAVPVRDALQPYEGCLGIETGFAVDFPIDLTLGRLHHLTGDEASALRLLRAVAERCHRQGLAPIEARSRWHLAEVLDAVGTRYDAAHERTAAEALAASCGMVLAGTDAEGVGAAAPPAPPAERDHDASLRRVGRTWRIDAPQGSGEVAHSIGLEQLARILAAAPGEVEATALVGGDATPVVERDLGPALDATAKRAYRQRLAELQAEVDEADDHHDPERAARARLEVEALMTELRRAVGLGGRDRPTASTAEKARINVARSVRRAIATIGAALPALGAHLDVSIVTGRYCRYAPEPATALHWTVDRSGHAP